MKPNFYITKRNGKNALWVNCFNIWDLTDYELTEDVKNAVMHAYFLGAKDMKNQIEATIYSASTELIWWDLSVKFDDLQQTSG